MPTLWPEIQDAIAVAQESTRKLAAIANAMNCGHLQFTLDGRLVGDIGELIAVRYFDIQLHTKQQGRHDAGCYIGGREVGVQVKCRVKSDAIDFASEPELLLVIQIDEGWSTWKTVYNGPGSVVRVGTRLTLDCEGRLLDETRKAKRRLNIGDFAKLAKQLSPEVLRVPERSTPSP